MKIVGQGLYANFDEMTWPLPDSEKLGDIEWKFRHAPNEVTRGDILTAASVMSAYRELILHKTNQRRNYISNKLKNATVKGG